MSKKLTALSLALLFVIALGLQSMAVSDETMAANTNNNTTRTDRTNMNDLNPFTDERTNRGVGTRDMIGNDGTNWNNNGTLNNGNMNNMGRDGYRGYNNDGFGTRATNDTNWSWLGLLGLIGLAGLFGRNRVEGENR